MITYLKMAQYLFPGVKESDVRFEDHDGTIVITEWNDAFGTKPTIAELDAVHIYICKNNKKLYIKEAMYKELNEGINGYTTQNLTTPIKLDSSRFDLDNFKNLMIYSQLVNLTQVTIKDYNNEMHTISVSDLQIIINELIGYGLWLFQRKWEKEYEIDQCTTHEEVEAITFV